MKPDTLTEAELTLASMSFADEYAEDREAALNKLQLLLIDRRLLQARIALLETLAPQEQEHRPAHDFTAVINAVVNRGFFTLNREGRLDRDMVKQLHRLTCDPRALERIHSELLQMPKETKQVHTAGPSEGNVQTGQVLTGPLFNEPVRVETVQPTPNGVTLGVVGLTTDRFRRVTLDAAQLAQLKVITATADYAGDGA